MLIELEGVDELSLRAFRSFIRTLRLHRQLTLKTLAERGSHPGQFFCLRMLADNDGLAQRDLARALHLARPTVTRMLQGMEKAGLVERSPDSSDQRLMRVTLTAAGRALEAEMRAISADYVDRTIGTLPDDDRRELARLLDEMGDSIKRAIAETVDATPGTRAAKEVGAP